MIEHDDGLADEGIKSLVRQAAPTSFGAGFSARVAARLRVGREPSMSVALERQVRRVVPLAAAASLMLAAYNWWGSRESASSTFEAALNLPRVSLSAAYSASTLFGATTVPVDTP